MPARPAPDALATAFRAGRDYARGARRCAYASVARIAAAEAEARSRGFRPLQGVCAYYIPMEVESLLVALKDPVDSTAFYTVRMFCLHRGTPPLRCSHRRGRANLVRCLQVNMSISHTVHAAPLGGLHAVHRLLAA